MRTSSNVRASPGSPASLATVMVSSAATRYCLPPVLITANILILVFKPGSRRGDPDGPASWQYRLRNAAGEPPQTESAGQDGPRIECSAYASSPDLSTEKARRHAPVPRGEDRRDLVAQRRRSTMPVQR